MSRPAKIIVLCEDLQMQSFIRHFFYMRGWGLYDFRFLPLPKEKRCGEQYVRENLPTEIGNYRRKCNSRDIALVAATDADTISVQDRRDMLVRQCARTGIDPPCDDEKILLVIPKRNIETWLAYLRGEDINENDKYQKYKGSESKCKADVYKLATMCESGRLEPPPPPSLEQCCLSFQVFYARIRR